jgi:hypothetical protein
MLLVIFQVAFSMKLSTQTFDDGNGMAFATKINAPVKL